ncbi:MAG: tRNA epoxyqueuosine(34) reductase QueG [Bacteroidetes bacterium]|nr:tRNA epoxyqueuosine(34) reductase QueG [Bacteroidota bacterium]
MNPQQASVLTKEIAHDLGFQFCGISQARFLEEEAPRLEEWLRRNYQGNMKYLEENFDKRLDPRKLVPGARTVVSLLYNYYPRQDWNSPLKFARYAYGEDYHTVIKDKLRDFMTRLEEKLGAIQGRVFVDSAPVHERAWAQRSGLGWIGKNSLLLHRQMGSYFFIAELIIDIEMAPDGPVNDYCGTCTACMDACPTDAIPEPYVVDGSKCISYLTIELKEEIPSSFKGQLQNWIFGCDICQEVCPWNRFANPHREPRFDADDALLEMKKEDWLELTEETFGRLFGKSPVKRTKYSGLRRNIVFVTENPEKDKAPGGA